MEYMTYEPISLSEIFNTNLSTSTGGQAVFVGYVRDRNEGRRVEKLFYECYLPLAEKGIRQIIYQAKNQWNIDLAQVRHRVGWLEIGDIAVVVRVDAAHRKDAFEASEWIVDEIKRVVPIWKKEFYQDKWQTWLTPAKAEVRQ